MGEKVLRNNLPPVLATEVYDKIKKIQNELKEHLLFKNAGLTVTTKGVLAKGCQCCKRGTWLCLFPGDLCTAKCHFCPNPHTPNYRKEVISKNEFGRLNNIRQIDEVKVLLELFANSIEGVSYSGGEPFLYLDRIYQISKHIQDNRLGLHQWIYTNGMIVKEDDFKKLKDFHVKEIRFNLVASNFKEKIVQKLQVANKYFETVTVEVPSIPIVYKKLIDEKMIHRLEDYGVCQINLEELVFYTDVCDNYYKNTKWYMYKKFLYEANSPVFSRLLTYDIIRYVIENKVDILINDCSNDSQALQSMQRQANPVLAMLSMI